VTGFLVHSPEGAAKPDAATLGSASCAKGLAENGHQHVKQNFLVTRNARLYPHHVGAGTPGRERGAPGVARGSRVLRLIAAAVTGAIEVRNANSSAPLKRQRSSARVGTEMRAEVKPDLLRWARDARRPPSGSASPAFSQVGRVGARRGCSDAQASRGVRESDAHARRFPLLPEPPRIAFRSRTSAPELARS